MLMFRELHLARWRCGFLGVCAICLLGCSGGAKGGPKLVAVTGIVTYKGQPVPGARVMFLGDGSQVPSVGVTASDGKFTLASLTGAGAVPGTHLVAIQKEAEETSTATFLTMEEAVLEAQKPPPAPPKKPTSLIPPKYAQAQTSGLQFEVKESGGNHFAIELTD
jgi:hypothetical protein